jgi:hypothetical protein
LASTGYQNVRRASKARGHRSIPSPNGGHRPQKLAILSESARDSPVMRMRMASSNGTACHDTLPFIYSHESGTVPTSGLDGPSDDALHSSRRKGRVPMAYRPRSTSAVHARQGHRSRRYFPIPTTPRTRYLELRKENLRSSPQGRNRGSNCKTTNNTANGTGGLAGGKTANLIGRTNIAEPEVFSP